MTQQGQEKRTSEERTPTEFLTQSEQSSPGILAEFWEFLCHNRKWWLAPIILALLLIGFLVFLSGSSLAPFIYPI